MTEIELFTLAQESPKHRELFLMKKQRLVHIICRTQYGSIDEDLIQEGNMGLLVAFDKFDPELGFKFDTYAKHWVYSYMQQYNWKKHVVRLGRTIRRKRLEEGGETVIPMVSLDTPEADCQNLELSVAVLSSQERLEQQQDIEFVRNYIKDIAPERNKHMFEDYYGLREDEPVNMTTLATKFGVSKQRCQQIISREIRKMKELYSTIDS